MGQKIETEFSWSVSRERLFHECERAYYYHYYGSWGGWDAAAPETTRKLYLLKKMTNAAMWAGSVVHQTIAEALNRYARKQTPVRAGELQARARQKLRQGWVEAVNRDWLTQPKKTNLAELYYGNGKTLPNAETERIKNRVYSALAAFADSSILREILTVPYLNWKPVDTLDSFVLDGLKVWCAIDFAYVDAAGKLRIVDWKTGAEHQEALKMQLACYALYAAAKWQCPPANTRLSGVFLSEQARARDCETSPETIVAAQERILSSAAEMRAKLVDIQANTAQEEDFTYCENPGTCARCNFREVCPRTQDNGGS